jgi:hypothetical protein
MMKEILQSYLEERLPLPGFAAWCAQLPDRTFMSHCYTDWFSPPQLEKIFGRLLITAEKVAQHGIQPVRVSWVFEHARIHLSRNSNGSWLACFVENRPDLENEPLEQLMNEFVTLRQA